MKKKIEIEIPEGKVAEWKEINGVTTLVLVEEKDNRPVTERIKTFEDACRELDKRAESNEGIAFLIADYESNECNIKNKSTLAYMKLCIIAAALNEGWEPKFTECEDRWHPLFYLHTQEDIDKMSDGKKKKPLMFGCISSGGSSCGLAFALSRKGWSRSLSNLSSRLAVKSKELARYFGEQFIDIWSDHLADTRECE